MQAIAPGAHVPVSLSFDALPLLDGGELEDLSLALATLTADDPTLLLQMFQEHAWDARQITRLVRMLPLDTVDDRQARLRVIEDRIAGLQSVRDAAVVLQKEAAIHALEEYRSRLRAGH